MEMYRSGRNEADSKSVDGSNRPGVRIPPSPPVNTTRVSNFFIEIRVVSYAENLALQGFPLFINNPDAS